MKAWHIGLAVLSVSLIVAGAFASPSDIDTSGTRTAEVLVLASAATTIPRKPGANSVEIQNLGPNAIYCAVGSSTAAVGTSRMIAASGGTWSPPAAGDVPIKCRAATADQLTTAATIVTEVP